MSLRGQLTRHSRLLLALPHPESQFTRLQNAKVLIIGCGGLGCPCAVYLAANAVGTIGLCDEDTIEIHNLGRQVAYTEKQAQENKEKTECLKEEILGLNSSTKVILFKTRITPQNAIQIISQFDIIVDATDNAPTRYLINDACVLAGKPLVSGSAIKSYGQMSTYNYGESGPCYRCINPVIPEKTQNCSDNGVIGSVCGIIGTAQANEVINIIVNEQAPYSGKMLVLGQTIRTVKLRSRQNDCKICGLDPTITSLEAIHLSCLSDKAEELHIIEDKYRVSAKTMSEFMDTSKVLDIRETNEWAMCRLPNTTHIPLRELRSRIAEVTSDKSQAIVCLCRRGNDSQIAVQQLLDMGYNNAKDMIGGLLAWSRDVDNQFEVY